MKTSKSQVKMKKWDQEAGELIKEAERFITETEIAMFVFNQLQKNETFLDSNEYYNGFREAMISVLEYINEMTRQRKISKEKKQEVLQEIAL